MYFPGLMFAETATRRVQNDEEGHKIALENKHCYGYELDRREDIVDNGKTYEGECETYKRVLFGKVYTLEDVERMGDVGNVLTNMKSNGYEKIVKTRCGWWRPLKEGTECVPG